MPPKVFDRPRPGKVHRFEGFWSRRHPIAVTSCPGEIKFDDLKRWESQMSGPGVENAHVQQEIGFRHTLKCHWLCQPSIIGMSRHLKEIDRHTIGRMQAVLDNSILTTRMFHPGVRTRAQIGGYISPFHS